MAKILKNLLAEYGYNLVALPRAGIEPLLLLYTNGGDVSSLDSDLFTLFEIGNKVKPSISRDNDVLDIEGSAEVAFDASIGVSVLSSLLEKLKMGKLSAKLKLDATNTVTISYQNIKEDKVDLLKLDNYISESEPSKQQFNTYQRMLENSQLYVVTRCSRAMHLP